MCDLKRVNFSSDEEFIMKVYEDKILNQMTNMECKDYVNVELQTNYSESTVRGIAKYTQIGYGIAWEKALSETKGETPNTRLDEIREKIGELDIRKQEVKTKSSQLNKIKRELIKSVEISNDLKEEMFKNGFKITIPDYCDEAIEIYSDNKMIVNISDWHIGYVIHNCKGNKFNVNIAKKRINKLVQEVEKYCNLYNINKIYVVNTGDILEHTYMRGNQSQNTELNQSQQINKAIELIYDFLVALNSFAEVDYYSLAGNHDRSCGDKSFNQDGDNANIIISEQLYKWNNLANNKRLNIINSDYLNKEIILEINSVKCKFIHGDEKIKDGKTLLQTEISMDEEFYNVLFRGHWHNFSTTSENRGRQIVNTGCLSGFNDYSSKFGCASNANQTICIIGDGEVEFIKGVDLQIN